MAVYWAQARLRFLLLFPDNSTITVIDSATYDNAYVGGEIWHP